MEPTHASALSMCPDMLTLRCCAHQGGFMMALGYLLTEEQKFDELGA